jgi:hypothetical protein
VPDRRRRDALELPVWLWDVDPRVSGRQSSRPTFGFTLSGGHGFGPPSFVTKVTPWLVSHSTRVRTLAVDADDVGTTDFNLSQEKQELLVHDGRVTATAFLDSFSLEQYENTYHADLTQNPPKPAAAA